MSTAFVARSQTLSKWGNDVGLTKFLFVLGLAEGRAEDAVAALNAEQFGSAVDWKVIAKRTLDGADLEAGRARLAARETAVDPTYYPRIKGARGIFKVKPANVEKHMMVKRAIAGEDMAVTAKPADIAAYMMESAFGAEPEDDA